MWNTIFQRLILLIRSPLGLCFSLGAHKLNSLKLSIINWVDQMRELVSLPENCGTNPGWAEWSWSTETSYTALLSVYFPMDPHLLPFVLHFLLLDFTNMHDEQRGTSYFKYRNIDGRTPIFSSLDMDLGRRWDNVLCHDLNSCCKGDSTSGNMML